MRDPRRQASLLLAATLAWTIALALLGAHEALLFCAPALLLALPLALGRYVGEDVLAFARERTGTVRGRAAATYHAPAFAGEGFLHRGGRLIAASLAKRPPPALASLT